MGDVAAEDETEQDRKAKEDAESQVANTGDKDEEHKNKADGQNDEAVVAAQKPENDVIEEAKTGQEEAKIGQEASEKAEDDQADPVNIDAV